MENEKREREMESEKEKKELIELVVEGIFNGVPVILDVCGIEPFNAADVFTYLRKGSETSYHGPGYDEKNIEKASKYSDETLKKYIEKVLFDLVATGVFIHNPGSEYGDFEPTELAYHIRRAFINGGKYIY